MHIKEVSQLEPEPPRSQQSGKPPIEHVGVLAGSVQPIISVQPVQIIFPPEQVQPLEEEEELDEELEEDVDVHITNPGSHKPPEVTQQFGVPLEHIAMRDGSEHECAEPSGQQPPEED